MNEEIILGSFFETFECECECVTMIVMRREGHKSMLGMRVHDPAVSR